MSRWIDKKLFDKYVENRIEEEKQRKAGSFERNQNIWPTPAAGTAEEAAVYEGRFLPDPNGDFTKKYYYHYWGSGTTWNNFLCPKTWNFSNWCPICSLVSVLYNGTEEDKRLAKSMKRKERFVANWYVVDDPRDKKVTKEEDKASGRVFIYAFPSKVEEKLKAEEEDDKNGLGPAVFDPGEDGYNFILKVKSTKPDENNKTFPDYSNSTFARRPSALGKEDEIEKIMESRHKLLDHVKSLDKSMDILKKALINENLFPLVEREWNKHFKTSAQVNVEDNVEGEDDVPFEVENNNPSSTKVPESDEDLLKKLDELKY